MFLYFWVVLLRKFKYYIHIRLFLVIALYCLEKFRVKQRQIQTIIFI